MSTSTPSGIRDSYVTMSHLNWSAAEKAIARKAFALALQREFEALIQETKQMAGAIAQPADLWELEGHLTRRRKEIDRVYDYRYSVLLPVFRQLVGKGRLRVAELDGLAESKLAFICTHPEL